MTALLKNLKVWQKLGLLGIVFLIPLIAVTWKMISSQHELGINFAQKEVYGTDYNTPVMPLIKLLQEHRGMVNAYLNGETSFRNKILAKRREISAQIKAVSAVDAEYGDILQSAERWMALKGRITSLTERTFNLQAADSFAQHTALIQEILDFMARVGDTSKLVFDPDQDSYYLMDAAVFVLPELTEVLAQARDLGVGNAARGSITPAERDTLLQRATLVEYYQRRLNTGFEKVYAFNPALQSKLEQQAKGLENHLSAFITELENGFLKASAQEADSNRIAVTIETDAWWNLATKNVTGAFSPHARINPLLKAVLQARIDRLSGEINMTIMWVALGLGVIGVLAFFIIRDITQPLAKAVSVAEHIAVGDLSVDVPAADRKDELGILLGAFGRMHGSLQNVARVAKQIAQGDLTLSIQPQSNKDVMGNALAKMVHSLRDLTGQLKKNTTTLAAAMNKILASIAQVAAGASETASAVSETATTVEEVKQTTLAASQKASAVLEASQNAVQVSQAGKRSVEEAVARMNRTREQMESIAESVTIFGEQSRAIGEIITSMTDLADQSNLLAINAAIEAANAGEHSRGFAVVAREVKSLADQSKQATSQVRDLLSDIQQATNMAVLVTEQGTKAVEAGVTQSVEAGGSLRQSAASIAGAARAVSQIAASSQQLLVEMEQVVTAVEGIKEASTQNIDSMGQMESASQQLAIVGSQLEDLVNRFTLNTNGAGA